MIRTERKPVIVGWSGGKDSTLALEVLRSSSEWEPVALLTTVTDEYDRISMHGVRTELLRVQADALDLPLTIVSIPSGASNAVYGERMAEAMSRARADGIRTVAFGDLFLEEVRRYRERMLARVRMSAIFPVWSKPTAQLSRYFVDAGYRAILTCVDTHQIPGTFAGRDYDHELLDELPENADPCGENGEFHTFVIDGPPFRHPVSCTRNGTILRDQRFMYCDLASQWNS